MAKRIVRSPFSHNGKAYKRGDSFDDARKGAEDAERFLVPKKAEEAKTTTAAQADDGGK